MENAWSCRRLANYWSRFFLDNEVGAAAATGMGEAMIKTAGSAMVVELMRY